MNRALAAATLLLLTAAARAQAPAGRDPMPNWSMRQLEVWSETAVVAAPVGPLSCQRFRTIRVLLGSALREADVFEINDLSRYDLTLPAADGEPGGAPVRPAELLLFLEPKSGVEPATRFSLTPSGLRIETANGGLYYPEQSGESGPYHLRPLAGVTWDELVRRAAADAAEVNHVRSLRAITDPHRRNVALLDWVEQRRREFGGRTEVRDGEEPATGWGSLEQDVFSWILESRIPADCWAAVKLYAELNQGCVPDLRSPAFGTRAGRALLLSVAADGAALTGHRVRALEALSQSTTLWPGRFDVQPPVEVLDAKEQAALIDRATPLLKDPGAAVRAAAARALLAASAPPDDGPQSLRTERALPALTAAYRAQPPGDARDALAEAVCVGGGAKRWQELTDNPGGLLALLQETGCRQAADVYGWMVMRRTDEAVHDAPTLVLERLDGAKVAEKKEIVLAPPAVGLINPPPPAGWQAGAVEHFTFSMADFTPGVWRMTIKGVVGKDKAAWASEPRVLRLAPPPQPGQPNPNPAAPRITFDP